MIKNNFEIRLPDNIERLPINEEYFFVTQNNQERRLKLHDYSEVYSIPGLYEYILRKVLNYKSPELMSSFLIEKVTNEGLAIDKLQVLEIGAGSGLFGKEISKLGVTSLIGIDIIPEAAIATARECPGVYQEYFVEDLTQLSESTKNQIKARKLNCLVCCSAIAADHIPVKAFTTALNLIQTGGWVMFNIAKNSYENQNDPPEFVEFYRQAISEGTLKVEHTHIYEHRRLFNGETFENVAILARKQD